MASPHARARLREQVNRLIEDALAGKLATSIVNERDISPAEYADDLLDRFTASAAIEAAKAELKKARAAGDRGVILYLKQAIACLNSARKID